MNKNTEYINIYNLSYDLILWQYIFDTSVLLFSYICSRQNCFNRQTLAIRIQTYSISIKNKNIQRQYYYTFLPLY